MIIWLHETIAEKVNILIIGVNRQSGKQITNYELRIEERR